MSVDNCLRRSSPGAPGPQPRGGGASSQATAGPTARTEVCVPVTWSTGGQDSSQELWHKVPNPTAPTQTVLLVGWCQIVVKGHLVLLLLMSLQESLMFLWSLVWYSVGRKVHFRMCSKPHVHPSVDARKKRGVISRGTGPEVPRDMVVRCEANVSPWGKWWWPR